MPWEACHLQFSFVSPAILNNIGYTCLSTAQVGPPPAFHPCIIPAALPTADFCTIDATVMNKRLTTPIEITNPNGSIMYLTHKAELDIPCLPVTARHVHIAPALRTHSLLSMGQLCDAGCKVVFSATTVNIRLRKTAMALGTPQLKNASRRHPSEH